MGSNCLVFVAPRKAFSFLFLFFIFFSAFVNLQVFSQFLHVLKPFSSAELSSSRVAVLLNQTILSVSNLVIFLFLAVARLY